MVYKASSLQSFPEDKNGAMLPHSWDQNYPNANFRQSPYMKDYTQIFYDF